VLFKKGGNSVNETSGLELYVGKKKKRTMFYYRINTKEQIAKANCPVLKEKSIVTNWRI
jgi:hypothetical protein